MKGKMLITTCLLYIHVHTEVSPDLILLYGCIHIWWKVAREESKLIFYEEEREIYNVTVRGVNYYQTDSEWLKGVSNKSDIIMVEITYFAELPSQLAQGVDPKKRTSS